MKILHFATWKCPNSGPILVLMFEYIIGGLYGPLRKKILYIDDQKCQISGPFLV